METCKTQMLSEGDVSPQRDDHDEQNRCHIPQHVVGGDSH